MIVKNRNLSYGTRKGNGQLAAGIHVCRSGTSATRPALFAGQPRFQNGGNVFRNPGNRQRATIDQYDDRRFSFCGDSLHQSCCAPGKSRSGPIARSPGGSNRPPTRIYRQADKASTASALRPRPPPLFRTRNGSRHSLLQPLRIETRVSGAPAPEPRQELSAPRTDPSINPLDCSVQIQRANFSLWCSLKSNFQCPRDANNRQTNVRAESTFGPMSARVGMYFDKWQHAVLHSSTAPYLTLQFCREVPLLLRFIILTRPCPRLHTGSQTVPVQIFSQMARHRTSSGSGSCPLPCAWLVRSGTPFGSVVGSSTSIPTFVPDRRRRAIRQRRPDENQDSICTAK